MLKALTLFYIFLKVAELQGQCVINPDGTGSWPEWPPIITDSVGDLILPTGVENDRSITLEPDQVN